MIYRRLILVALAVFELSAWAQTKPVLIVVDMKKEAELFHGQNVITVIASAQPAVLQDRLVQYNSGNVSAIYCIGVGHGLSPELKPGQLVVADKLADDEHAQAIANPLLTEFTSALGLKKIEFVKGTFTQAEPQVVASPEGRANLRKLTNADVSDNVSFVVQKFAEVNNLPFVLIRAIADSASTSLPPAAIIPLLPDGEIDMASVQVSLSKNMLQMTKLLTLNIGWDAAFSSLRKVAPILQGTSGQHSASNSN